MRPTSSLAISSFVFLFLAATVMLALPGILPAGRLPLLDAFFLASSAVTLTGLTPVAVSGLTPLGQGVLLLVFQVAGILAISFSTLLLACPGVQHSKSSHRLVPERWLEIEEIRPARLVLAIAVSTLLIEAAGGLAVYLSLHANAAVPRPVFTALFLAASAFCNAGFSTLSPLDVSGGPASAVPITLSALAVLGGLGYVVLRALFLWARGKQRLGYHSRLVLSASILLLALGAALYYLFERLSPGGGAGKTGWPEALFRAATVRTAGFDLGARQPSSTASKLLSMLLMLIGGAPGSAAGGLKLTTAVAVGLLAIGGSSPADRSATRAQLRLSKDARVFAALHLVRALLLLAACVLMLAVTETLFNSRAAVAAGSLVFEAVSAFTTTGITTGVTKQLSAPGKAMLSLTMLAGRLGLLVIAARLSGRRRSQDGRLMLKQAEVLFGG